MRSLQMKKRLYILLFALVLVTGGCKKQLNVFPTTSEVDGNIIVDTKSAQTVLNGVYYQFASGTQDYNGVPATGWFNYHEVMYSFMAGTLDYAGGGGEFEQFAIDDTNSASDLLWSYNYLLVNAANGFLKNLEPVGTIPETRKIEMKAEGMFLRAFANTQLLLTFGEYRKMSSPYGILLRKEFINANNINQARATVADSYAFILQDLDFAISNLPLQGSQLYYTNRWVAKLLKARLLINRAAPGDYAQVISLTDDIIKNSPFLLEKNQRDIFWTKGFSSKEVMMSIQPYADQQFKFVSYQQALFYAGTNLMTQLFEGDPRRQWVYTEIEDAFLGPVNEVTKYYSGDPDPNVAVPVPNVENSYAFRLSEAYLLKAEALSLSGGDMAEARTLLKTVVGNAGVTDFSEIDNAATGPDLQLLIVKEFMKNFVCENGIDWYALRRLPFATLQNIRPAIPDQTRLILPIPHSERVKNPNIQQNEGY
jgi:hypothetical protein